MESGYRVQPGDRPGFLPPQPESQPRNLFHLDGSDPVNTKRIELRWKNHASNIKNKKVYQLGRDVPSYEQGTSDTML